MIGVDLIGQNRNRYCQQYRALLPGIPDDPRMRVRPHHLTSRIFRVCDASQYQHHLPRVVLFRGRRINRSNRKCRGANKQSGGKGKDRETLHQQNKVMERVTDRSPA
jgi:hypothetical protein